MLTTVAEIKGWHVEDQWDEKIEENKWGAVRKLEENWKAFQRGDQSHCQQISESKDVGDEASMKTG